MTGSAAADRIRARLDAPGQVTQMIDAAAEWGTGFLDKLRQDALGTLEQCDDIAIVKLSAQQSVQTSCSIAGMYLGETTPPRLAVAEATRARMQFTVLHEFGHHLQQTTETLGDSLLDRDDGGAALEEAACDLFAAQVLIPDDIVERVLGSGTPAATDLVRLWSETEASRAAICVVGVQRLATDGMVLVLDGDGVVEFCATRGRAPVRRGTDQSGTELFTAMRKAVRGTAEAETTFSYRDGIRGLPMWAQASEAGTGHWIVVAAESHVPWRSIALPSTARVLHGRWWTCELCGHSWEVFTAFHDCGSPVCPDCGRCNCRLALKEKTCTECFTVKPAHQFEADSDKCIDCVS